MNISNQELTELGERVNAGKEIAPIKVALIINELKRLRMLTGTLKNHVWDMARECGFEIEE